jgi:anti-sigma B factor antagonist
MSTMSFAAPGLKLHLEEKADETIVHCIGRIGAENSEAFQKEIHSLIPDSRGHAAAIACRIVLDLANVTHVDCQGLGALSGAWTAARSKRCDLEIANLNPRIEKLFEITKLDTIFKKVTDLFGSARPNRP